MAKPIEHQGVIDAIERDRIIVRIVQNSACSGCSAKQLCNAAEQKEKLVEVYNINNVKQYKLGDTVTVCAAQHVGTKAVLMAFVYPTLLMLAIIFGVHSATGNELYAAIGGFCVLPPYLLFLYFTRDRLKKEFSFWIQ